jgi:HD-GYP domain-containing protein (c-di-GMP phosphodiesterase class II)
MQTACMGTCNLFSMNCFTNYRPYSKVLSFEEAIEKLKKGAGSQFGPNLTEKFISIIERNQKP